MVKAMIQLKQLVLVSQFTFNYEVTLLCYGTVGVCHSACVVATVGAHRVLNSEFLLAT